MHIGKTISQIRKDKNIPVRYLTKDCMSKSTYDYFIEGKINISAAKFNVLMDRLHLSWNEFEYINYNSYLKIINEMKLAILNKNIQKLEYLKSETYIKFRNHKMLKYNKYFHLYCVLSIFIEMLKGNKIKIKYTKIIKNYLLSRYTWTYYELSLFNDSFFIFSFKDIKIFIRRISRDLQKYNLFKPYENEYIRFLMNIALLCIKTKKLRSMKNIIKQINKAKIQDNTMLEKLSIKYIKGIAMIIQHKYTGFNLIKRALNCFKFITPNTYYPAIKRNYRHIIKIYNIKDNLKSI